MVCNWPWFGRTVTGLYCNRVRIGAERFALKVHSFIDIAWTCTCVSVVCWNVFIYYVPQLYNQYNAAIYIYSI